MSFFLELKMLAGSSLDRMREKRLAILEVESVCDWRLVKADFHLN